MKDLPYSVTVIEGEILLVRLGEEEINPGPVTLYGLPDRAEGRWCVFLGGYTGASLVGADGVAAPWGDLEAYHETREEALESYALHKLLPDHLKYAGGDGE